MKNIEMLLWNKIFGRIYDNILTNTNHSVSIMSISNLHRPIGRDIASNITTNIRTNIIDNIKENL